MNRSHCLLIATALFLVAPAAARGQRESEEKLAAQISKLLIESKLDEAQSALATALEAYPKSSVLQNRQFAVSIYLSRAGRHAEAVQQIDAYVAFLVAQIAETGEEMPLASYVDRAASAYGEARQVETGKRRVEQWLAKLAESRYGHTAALQAARLELLGAKALLLAADDHPDDALALVRETVAEARSRFERQPDDAAALANLARALMLQHRIAARLDAEHAAEAGEQYATFLSEQVAKHRDHIELLTLYGAYETETILGMIEQDLPMAEQRLEQFNEFLRALDTSKPAIAAFRRAREQAAAALGSRIQTARRHLELVGQPAAPLGQVTWLNGTPLTSEELAGKVVLLDFWAVWCGPCIATFPELRQWHERYAEKGLVIIGVTRHYEYGWNDETKRPERSKVTPDEENQALLRFATHHQLAYRFAVVEGNELMDHYGVTGIPQVVVIDRHGLVRLIRVGSGEANSHAIETLLEELVAAEAPASAAGEALAE